jgi:oligopeptide/dipeptide ABC transporter ATP-binding protein
MEPESHSPILKVSNVTVQYRLGTFDVRAMESVSLEIPSKKYTLGIVGESGSGKTTLGLSIMNAVPRPGHIVEGKIEYRGKNVLDMEGRELRKYRWGQVAMVYQSAMNSLSPVKRAVDHIVEVIREHKHLPRSVALGIALQLLSEVGISKEHAFDYPHQLSGGMRQRVVIALALALDPQILVLDEPTSALDVVTQRQILALLKKEITSKGLAVLFITHEISLLSGMVENIIVMYGGEIVESGPIDKILYEPLHPYTQMLIATLLTFSSGKDSLRAYKFVKEGAVARGNNLCKYSSRCQYAFDRCHKEKPLLRAFEGRSVACHKFEV